MARIRTAVPIALAGLAFAAPRVASACHEVTVCINWEAEITDNDFGEDLLLEDKVPARGARVTLLRPSPEPPLSRFLDAEGCMTFETQFAFGHKLVVFAEAWIGSPDPVQILARRQATSEATKQTGFFWVVDLHGLAPNDVVEFSVVGGAKDPIAPLMAITTEVMHRFDQLGVIPPQPASLKVDFLDWFGNARGSCGLVQFGPDSFREKFLVGHEMGHWLHCEWNGFFGPPSNYSYGEVGTPPDPDCQFGVTIPKDLDGDNIGTDGNHHGLRSAEWSLSGMREGFAHFIAAVAFNQFVDPNDATNEDGIFRYYKDINIEAFPSYADFVDPQQDNSRVSLLGDNALGGQKRWTANECMSDWDEDEVSTGLDWMRFFWHFLTRSGDSPTLLQILEFFAFVEADAITYPVDEVNVFPVLQDAMGDSLEMSQFLTRFNNANTAMGVFNAD